YVFQFFAEFDRAPELQQANDDRPSSDEHQQDQGRRAGIDECYKTGENTNDTSQPEPPARCHVTSVGYRRPWRETPVRDRADSPAQDERQQCKARPEESPNAEGNGSTSAQEQPRPVVRQRTQQAREGGVRSGMSLCHWSSPSNENFVWSC